MKLGMLILELNWAGRALGVDIGAAGIERQRVSFSAETVRAERRSEIGRPKQWTWAVSFRDMRLRRLPTFRACSRDLQKLMMNLEDEPGTTRSLSYPFQESPFPKFFIRLL